MSLPESYGRNVIWTVSRSAIHGQGVFAMRYIPKGELIGVAIGRRYMNLFPTVTYFGSKVNHSSRPNVALRHDYATGTDNVYASEDILPDTELLADYNATPSYIAKPDPRWK